MGFWGLPELDVDF